MRREEQALGSRLSLVTQPAQINIMLTLPGASSSAALRCRRVTAAHVACPMRRGRLPQRAFADDVPGMASGNCITDATTRGLLQQLAATGGGDGGSKGTGGSDGGGGGSGGNSGSSGGGGSFGDVPHPLRGATFAFAALLTVGGGYGYFKKGSAKSLGAGLGAALILALCAKSMVGPAGVGPARVAFALCTLLGIAMASRFNNSKKFMPAGLVAMLSLGLAVGFVGVGL